jgi:hypothetical protein
MRKNRYLALLLLATTVLIFVVPLLAVSQDRAEAQSVAVVDIGRLSETPRGAYGNFGTFSQVHGGVDSEAWKNVKWVRKGQDVFSAGWGSTRGPSARPGGTGWSSHPEVSIVGAAPLEGVYAYRPLIVDLAARAIYGMKEDGPGGRDRVSDFIGEGVVTGYSPGWENNCNCGQNGCNPTGIPGADTILFANRGRAYLPAGSHPVCLAWGVQLESRVPHLALQLHRPGLPVRGAGLQRLRRSHLA